MARALIVGCGCLGTELGQRLVDGGWAVRGTSRTGEGAARIEDSGLEGVVADPDRVGEVLEQVADVAIVIWALAVANGPSAADVNGPRLERMLERLVDTPVRGFVLEAPDQAHEALNLVAAAERTWRIPARVVSAPREYPQEWVAAMADAVNGLIAAPG